MNKGLSLSTRLTLLVGILLFAVGGIIGSTLWVTNAQKADGLVINLAGRQRMLTQKYTKELYQELHTGAGPSTEHAASERTRALFEQTMAALSRGGTTYTDLGKQQPVVLHAATNPEIVDQLATVATLWKSLQQSVDQLRATESGSEAYADAYGKIITLNVECLKNMNAAVGMYQSISDNRVTLLKNIQYTAGVIALVVFIAVILYIRFRVSRPLNEALNVANAVAAGDLTQSCPITTTDEVGQLSFALNEMCGKLKQIVQNISSGAINVSGSATQLLSTSSELTSGAAETADQSATVAAAAEEMSVNMNNMALSTEQMSSNVKTVASAVEEMTATVSEIAKNADQAASVADQAAALAQASNDSVGQLGSAAEAIGNVIGTIQDIAEQTNLLALNATIEAARAGDAGKGFAVVATEVKELAKQSADAAEDIRQRIEGIQSSTDSAVASIEDISEVIGKVNDVSRSIASAVEEQSITTKEIANSIAQTASAAEVVSTNVSETALATAEITESITRVNAIVKKTEQGAGQTETSSRDLTHLADSLRETIGQFTTGVEHLKQSSEVVAVTEVTDAPGAPTEMDASPLNCWEVKKCGRERGGAKAEELGECKAATLTELDGANRGTNGGRACWAITGTLCGGKVQGDYAKKVGNCLACEFYQQVGKEEGANHESAKDLIKKIG